MRTFAILVNLILLTLVGKLMVGENFEMNSTEVPLFLSLLAAPVISIIALLLRGAPNKDWLARYCERKALEERQKLDGMRPSPAQQMSAGDAGERSGQDCSRMARRA